MKIIKNLQFDYYPILRACYSANELVSKDFLKDDLEIKYNDNQLWNNLQLNKKNVAVNNICINSDITLDTENTIELINKQSFLPDNKNMLLKAIIKLNMITNNKWNLSFNYDFSNIQETNLEEFNSKFGVGYEKFHFKLNGEALISNQLIKSGENYKVSKEFYWKGETPILFEIEEFGISTTSIYEYFIQGVRFTIK
jgi:hypothetical protein